MRRLVVAAAALGALLVGLAALGCAGEAPASGQSSSGADRGAQLVRAGAAHYRASCAVCHGREGQGLTGLGTRLAGNDFVKTQSDQALLEFLVRGRSPRDPASRTGQMMPPRGGNPALAEDDLRAIVAFLREL